MGLVFIYTTSHPFTWQIAKKKSHYIYFFLAMTLLNVPTIYEKLFGILPIIISLISTVVTLSIFPIFSKFYLKQSWLKAILSFCSLIILSILTDFLLTIFITKIMHLPLDTTSTLLQSFGVFMLIIIVLFATFITDISNKRLHKPLTSISKSLIWLLIIPLVFFICMYLFFISTRNSGVIEYNYSLGVGVFIAIFLIVLILLYYTKRQQNKMHIQFLENEKNTLTNYTKTVDNLYMDMRHYKHDIQNILLSLRHFIDQEDYSSLKQFYYTHILEQSPVQNETYQLLCNMHPIKHLSLKGLIFSKIEDMTSANITLQLELMESIEHIPMDDIDLCRVVGILLDNAIESATESVHKTIILTIDITDEIVHIGVSNSYMTQPDVQKMFKNNYSTKAKGRGIGLHSLTTLLNKHPNTCLKYKLDELFFTQCIEIAPIC